MPYRPFRCAHLVPELVQLDGQGYPVFLDMAVPHWLRTQAQQAVQMCPSLALRLTAPAPREPPGLLRSPRGAAT
jgi:ferredoxin